MFFSLFFVDFSSSLVVDDPMVPVRDGDIIQLIHGMTGRALNR